MKNPYLPKFRQQLWTIIHYPLHLALCLFIQGFTQLVIWTKVFNVMKTIDPMAGINEDDYDIKDESEVTTKIIRDIFAKIVQNFFNLFTPQYLATQEAVTESLDQLSTVNDTFWVPFFDYALTGQGEDKLNATELKITTEALQGLGNAMKHALLEKFKISLVKEVEDYNTAHNITDMTGTELEADLARRLNDRFHLIVSAFLTTASL